MSDKVQDELIKPDVELVTLCRTNRWFQIEVIALQKKKTYWCQSPGNDPCQRVYLEYNERITAKRRPCANVCRGRLYKEVQDRTGRDWAVRSPATPAAAAVLRVLVLLIPFEASDLQTFRTGFPVLLLFVTFVTHSDRRVRWSMSGRSDPGPTNRAATRVSKVIT